MIETIQDRSLMALREKRANEALAKQKQQDGRIVDTRCALLGAALVSLSTLAGRAVKASDFDAMRYSVNDEGFPAWLVIEWQGVAFIQYEIGMYVQVATTGSDRCLPLPKTLAEFGELFEKYAPLPTCLSDIAA